MIEVGCQEDLIKEERHCPFCGGKGEDEYHFLMSCNKYDQLRSVLQARIQDECKNFYNLNATVLLTFPNNIVRGGVFERGGATERKMNELQRAELNYGTSGRRILA